MTTAIRGIKNNQSGTVSIKNIENPGNDLDIDGGNELSTYIWISQHKDKPLKVATSHGTCSFWDEDWKIMFHWENDPDTVLRRDIHDRQEFKMNILSNGLITLD